MERSAQTVSQGSLVTLIGTESLSPNGGTIVSYSWVQTSGIQVSLNNDNIIQYSISRVLLYV